MTISSTVPFAHSAVSPDTQGLSPLLDAAIAGNKTAMDALLKKLRPYLHALVRSRLGPEQGATFDHSDLVQDGLVRIYQNLGRLRERTVPHLLGWAGKIVRNLVLDALRAKQREPVKDREARIVEVLGRSLVSDGDELRTERLLVVAQALAQLPERRRQVIELYFLEQLSDSEICQRLGGSVGAVRVLRFRALEELRHILQNSTDSDCRPSRAGSSSEKGYP